MIEIIQPGQAGKIRSLIEMHKVRKLIFKDRMGWDVDINAQGMEIDEYDLPETVYILARDSQGRVAGVWRMLPSSSPSMIRDIWPDFLINFNMRMGDSIWELSRFGVHNYEQGNPRENIKNVGHITAQLIVALLKVCSMTGIENIYTMYNHQVARSVRKIGFYAEEISDEILINEVPSVVGRVKTDADALHRVQRITGVDFDISPENLPPILQERIHNLKKEKTNVAA